MSKPFKIITKLITYSLISWFLFGLINAANSAPPPPNSEDWEIMKDFVEWIQSRTNKSGVSCCSAADGRPVDARINVHGEWEAFVGKKKFGPDAPDAWLVIPKYIVQYTDNPVGLPILFWYNGTVFCFFPPAGT